jgi:hypothetical protein
MIFDTKFIKLTDGRLLHLDRSGCNNDNAGRNLSDYTGKIYTEKEFKEYVNKFMKNGKADYWELKIHSKNKTFYEYGEHLLRMAKRAVTFNNFIQERYFYGERFDGVELYEPEEKILTAKEFDKVFYDYLYGKERFRYRRLTTKLKTEEDIMLALNNEEVVRFYVGKKYKKIA